MNRLTISQNEVQNWILFSPSVPMHSILNVFSSCGLEWSTRVIDCKTQIEALAGKIWIKEQTRKEKKERKEYVYTKFRLKSPSWARILVSLVTWLAISIYDCALCVLKISKNKSCACTRAHEMLLTPIFSLFLLSIHFRLWISISAIFHFLHLFFFRMEFLVKKTQTCVSSDDDDDDDMTTKCS